MALLAQRLRSTLRSSNDGALKNMGSTANHLDKGVYQTECIVHSVWRRFFLPYFKKQKTANGWIAFSGELFSARISKYLLLNNLSHKEIRYASC
jgi:hypothetical protein